MQYKYLPPSPALEGYIDYYLVIECSKGVERHPVTVYPAPQAEMVFNYGDISYEQATAGERIKSSDIAVSGFFTQTTTYTNENNLAVIMVGFKPWGIQPFITFNAGEITNINLSMEHVYPGKINEVENRLKGAGTIQLRIQVIENFLLSIIRPFKPDELIIESVKEINRRYGQISVAELARSFFLSEKQFKRRFNNSVGINPKLFSRLVRFQHILQCMDNSKVALLDTAIQTGFYDEAHFIKEFMNFTGKTPSSYIDENKRSSLGTYLDEQFRKSLFYNTIYR
ncbi:MAG: helix-turn-helix transcriptional regulator [Chitinophagaceae bacterium]|nr:helix-turn-helix transcriptional regulator [Chitinophagaceae bacterium]